MQQHKHFSIRRAAVMSMLLMVVWLAGCRTQAEVPFTNRLMLMAEAQDSTYGYTPDNPIKVGQPNKKGRPNDPLNHATLYLNTLPAPGRKPIVYQLIGYCCDFHHPDAFAGIATLQVFQLRHPKWEAPRTLFLNVWESDTLYVPVGLGKTGFSN
jgi:hypothetical protein